LAGKAEDAGGGVGGGGGGGGGGGTVVVVVGGDVVVVVGGDVVVVVGGDVVVVVGASDCVVDVRVVVVTADAPTPVPIPPNTTRKRASMRTTLPNNTVRSLTSPRRPCTASCPTTPLFLAALMRLLRVSEVRGRHGIGLEALLGPCWPHWYIRPTDSNRFARATGPDALPPADHGAGEANWFDG
jgi:hypothetical protein